jgi:hypothetical protein
MFIWISRFLLVVAGAAFVAATLKGVPPALLLLYFAFSVAIVSGAALTVVDWLSARRSANVEVEMTSVFSGSAVNPQRKRNVARAITALGILYSIVAVGALALIDSRDTPLIACGMTCAGLAVYAIGAGYLADMRLRDEFGDIATAMREGKLPNMADQRGASRTQNGDQLHGD